MNGVGCASKLHAQRGELEPRNCLPGCCLSACDNPGAFCSLAKLGSVRAALQQPSPGDGPAKRAGELHTASLNGAAAQSAVRMQSCSCCYKSPASSCFSCSLSVLCKGTGGTRDGTGMFCECSEAAVLPCTGPDAEYEVQDTVGDGAGHGPGCLNFRKVCRCKTWDDA